jgi:hypothetical protein
MRLIIHQVLIKILISNYKRQNEKKNPIHKKIVEMYKRDKGLSPNIKELLQSKKEKHKLTNRKMSKRYEWAIYYEGNSKSNKQMNKGNANFTQNTMSCPP